MQLDLKGIERLEGSTRNFQRRIMRTVENALRRGVRAALKDVNTAIRTQSGLGRTIWGKRAKGLKPLATLIRPRLTGDSIETGIKLKGLAAMIERGGHIAPHVIEPAVGSVLVFRGRLGTVFAKKVNHPGAPVRGHGFAKEQLEQHSDRIVAEVEKATGAALKEAFGGV